MVNDILKNTKNTKMRMGVLKLIRKTRIKIEKKNKKRLEKEKNMKTNCKHVSNKGNGHNCKKSPKNPKSLLLEGCTFYRENGLNGNGKEIIQAEILCKNLNDCYAKKNDLEYWKTVLVPEVQEKIRRLDEQANAKEKVKV